MPLFNDLGLSISNSFNEEIIAGLFLRCQCFLGKNRFFKKTKKAKDSPLSLTFSVSSALYSGFL
jgi:hypothetical protein